jgi:ornithine cyclodeaminase/alanine dehydrogenase-like protein (mu-crystallin family)
MAHDESGTLLYLSRADVVATGLDIQTVERAVEQVFVDKALGRIQYHPKTTVKPSHGLGYFLGMPGDVVEPPVAGIKWVGLAPPSPGGGPHIVGLIVLSDSKTCAPLAVLDATWITGVRTAAVTAVGARMLANPGSSTITFIACGLQARTHLDALRLHFPITDVIAVSRRAETAAAFADHVTGLGLKARVAVNAEDAVRAADIVVSSVPPSPGLKPFLDPRWIKSGGFAAFVDLGRSWLPGGVDEMDGLVTDDVPQAQGLAGHGHISHKGPYSTDIGEIVAGRKPGRTRPDQRFVLLPPGMVLSDLAVGAEVLKRARAKGLGIPLPF